MFTFLLTKIVIFYLTVWTSLFCVPSAVGHSLMREVAKENVVV